jgi:hypothetical protein
MFFTFSQNNSYGKFVYDDGLAHHVVIEAMNWKDANIRALDYGLYFDGVSRGRDCDCCGDRWYEQYASEGTEAPEVYGEADLHQVAAKDRSGDEGPTVVVVNMSGIREWFAKRALNDSHKYDYDLGDDDVIEDQMAIGA